MAEIIPFPMPKIQMTEEETNEYWEIKSNLDEAKTIREIKNCEKQVKEFQKRIKERIDREMR